jgi:hypothetical protein
MKQRPLKSIMGIKMKKEIKNMLTNVVGEELGQKIFDANFPEPLDGYMPGRVLKLKELKTLPENTVIYVKYLDEDGNERENGFLRLSKHDDEEYSADGFSFPIKDLKDEDLLENCDNCGWSFTVREAVPAKRGEFFKLQKKKEETLDILEQMQELCREIDECSDKAKKKELKAEFKALEKKFRKSSNF